MYGIFLWFIFLFSFSYSEYSFVTQIVISGIRIVMHQSIPATPSSPLPPPPPSYPHRPLRGTCPPCQSRGWGVCKFCAAREPGICQPRGQPRAFDTHAVSYQNTTAQRILLEKQRDWLICQGRETNEEVCKGMFLTLCMHFVIAYQARITGRWSYQRESTVIESNFCWVLFQEHPFIFLKLFITVNFTAYY